ncbi:uncharacterized protein LOC124649033 isoform X2 [Lolium rigidum]|uniref:uncharacterized protein LOC124649033 isoform X2 n=1 Tax=Lolium rigidum TaxID=89674 RepID=UPI001F5C5D35|nr:uncharacterized protein LOC124649033 isoform X2 [Lolium rigidum]
MTHRWPFLITIFVKITFTYVVYTVSVQLCQDGCKRNFIFSYHVFPRLDIQVFYYLSGHDMFPHSSSSYSGRMLIHEPDSIVHRHAAMHNPLTRIPSEMFPPLQANIAPERRRGPRPLHNSTGRPSRAVTSPPPRAVTSPSRTCVPPHRHRAQVEATSPPPLSGQAQLSRRGWRSIPLHPHRHTIQGHKRFDWVKELRSWSDDGLD